LRFSWVIHRIDGGKTSRVPRQALVIHLFFAAAVVPVRLSTHTLGIIAARAVPPYLCRNTSGSTQE
jgi:hypothetical protein